MKQNFHFRKFVLTFLFFICIAFLFCACGLDTYYVMDRKPSAGDIREYTNDDPVLRYFEFYSSTNPNEGNSEFRFLGTAVYYKIYANASTMVSHHNSIESVNNSTNYSAAAERMLSYGYQELGTDSGSVSPLVPEGMEGCYVRIRLTNYYETNASQDWWTNVARIEIKQSKNSEEVIASYIPRRSRGSAYPFDFGRNGKPAYNNDGLRYDAPVSGDEDFDGSTVSDNKYYIAMYAVAKGRDTTFTNYYSNVIYLGSMTLDASVENN